MRAVIQNAKHWKRNDQTQKLNKVQPKKAQVQTKRTNQKVRPKPGITQRKTGMMGRWNRETAEHESKTEPMEVSRQTNQEGRTRTWTDRERVVTSVRKPDRGVTLTKCFLCINLTKPEKNVICKKTKSNISWIWKKKGTLPTFSLRQWTAQKENANWCVSNSVITQNTNDDHKKQLKALKENSS